MRTCFGEMSMSRPPFRLARLAFMACCILAACSSRSSAEPMSIGFTKMVDGAEVIAVARLAGKWDPGEWKVSGPHGGTLELEFTKVLKGDLKPGKYRVCYDDLPHVSKDGEFVAFFGKGLCWRFAAHPISPANSVADGLLRVQGFYDWNGYYVFPGLVTLRQIETFLRDRTLVYTIAGPLYCPRRGQAEWESSPLRIEVLYDARTGKATAEGLPELKGFPAHPAVSVGSPWANQGVLVAYSRGTETPLVLHGHAESVDPVTGVMRAKFVVAEPLVLTREDFESYVSDPQKGSSSYTVIVTCTPFGDEQQPRVLKLTMGKVVGRDLEGWGGVGLHVHLTGSDSTVGGRVTVTTTARLPSGEDLELKFDCGEESKKPALAPGGAQSNLLYRLLAGEVPGKVLLKDEQGERDITTFTASLGEVRYAKLDRPRLMAAEVESRGEAEDEGVETFRCRTGEQEATVPLGDQGRLLHWAGASVAILVAAVLGWWLWRRRGTVLGPG
jgi:hypothetical protein